LVLGLVLSAVLAFSLAPPPATASIVYNGSADYSITSNPNGVWSYGTSTTATSPFAPFTLYGVADTTAYNNANLDRWSVVPGSGPDDTAYPFLMVNTGAVSVTVLDVTLTPGEMVLHPGALGEVSILRWTAPGTGVIGIDATFTGVSTSTTTTDVHVLRNLTALFDGLINIGGNDDTEHYGTTSLAVNAGDTISFVVGRGNGNFTFDTTSLAATIDYTANTAAVPEPGTAILVGFGAMAAFVAARGRRA